jgi:hypothetical protein
MCLVGVPRRTYRTRFTPRPSQGGVSGTLAAMASSLRDVIEGAIATLESLGALGEEIEDEWTYVTDLVAAQRLRLEAIVERRADEPAADVAERAVELAGEEAGLVTDPHRAIDWLSTFPELVALAVGEPVGGG